MDLKLRAKLIETIKQQGLPTGKGPVPVVTLEEFFTGNDDLGSIGCNLMEHPGTGAFYETLRAIRSRPEVQDVLVGIYEVEEADESMWPFSEHVYILTSAPQTEIESWMVALQPDEIGQGYTFGTPRAAPELKPGMHPWTAWWD
jgi:hypothetical protein